MLLEAWLGEPREHQISSAWRFSHAPLALSRPGQAFFPLLLAFVVGGAPACALPFRLPNVPWAIFYAPNLSSLGLLQFLLVLLPLLIFWGEQLQRFWIQLWFSRLFHQDRPMSRVWPLGRYRWLLQKSKISFWTSRARAHALYFLMRTQVFCDQETDRHLGNHSSRQHRRCTRCWSKMIRGRWQFGLPSMLGSRTLDGNQRSRGKFLRRQI